MSKLLMEVIGQSATSGSPYTFSGSGKTQFTTAGELAARTNTPMGQGDTNLIPRGANDDNLKAFLDKLGIVLHDFEFEVNNENPIFSDKPQDDFDKNRGHGSNNRPADYAAGEDHHTYQAFNESATNFVQQGQIVEATVMFRGVRKHIRVFYPSNKAVSLYQLQEDLSKLIPSTVVINIGRESNSPRSIQGTPAVLLERTIAQLNAEGILYLGEDVPPPLKADSIYDSIEGFRFGADSVEKIVQEHRETPNLIHFHYNNLVDAVRSAPDVSKDEKEHFLRGAYKRMQYWQEYNA